MVNWLKLTSFVCFMLADSLSVVHAGLLFGPNVRIREEHHHYYSGTMPGAEGSVTYVQNPTTAIRIIKPRKAARHAAKSAYHQRMSEAYGW